MFLVTVKFENNDKEYYFKTKYDNLICGQQYHIVNEHNWDYKNAVVTVIETISDTCWKKYSYYNNIELKEIIKFTPINKKREHNIRNVWFNEAKGVTVVEWRDGTKTKVRCHKEDVFDKEKGLFAACAKRLYHNQGYYLEDMKKWL